MRCVLDHLVFAIAVHESGTFPPPGWKQLAFPIVESDTAFDGFSKGKFGKGSIRFISDDVAAAIKTMQPYKRAHPNLPPLLRLLRDFDDGDKHRLVHLGLAQPVEWEFDNITGLTPECGKFGVVPEDPVELKDNTKIATLVTDGPAPDLNFDRFRLSVAVVVSHEAGPAGTNYSRIEDMIHQLGDEVRIAVDTVLSAVK